MFHGVCQKCRGLIYTDTSEGELRHRADVFVHLAACRTTPEEFLENIRTAPPEIHEEVQRVMSDLTVMRLMPLASVMVMEA